MHRGCAGSASESRASAWVGAGVCAARAACDPEAPAWRPRLGEAIHGGWGCRREGERVS